MDIQYKVDPQALSAGVTAEHMGIDVSKKAKLFKVLAESMYPDAGNAVIRETASNAHDSHVMGGNANEPFQITAPTWDSPTYTIRDYGVGLTAAEAKETVLNFLASTKDDSDDFIGGWGLGSKSPYAFCTSFTIYCYKDGVQVQFECWQDASGMPTYALVDERPTAERNGVKYVVPVAVEKMSDFNNKLFRYYDRTNFKVVITNAEEAFPERRVCPAGHWLVETIQCGDYTFHVSNVVDNDRRFYVVYGGYTYSLADISALKGSLGKLNNLLNSSSYSLALEAKVGNCEFAVSRENLADKPQTHHWVEAAISALEDHLDAECELHMEQSLFPIHQYVKGQRDKKAPVDFAHVQQLVRLSREALGPDKKVASHSFFQYFSHSRYMQHFECPRLRNTIKTRFGTDKVTSLFEAELELNTFEPFKEGGVAYATKNVYGVKLAGVRTHQRKNGSRYHQGWNKVSVGYNSPIENQIVVLWSPTRITPHSMVLTDGHEAPANCIMIVAEEEEHVLRYLQLIGLEGIEPVHVLSYPRIRVDKSERERARSSGARLRHPLPKRLYCDVRQETVVDYESDETYYYTDYKGYPAAKQAAKLIGVTVFVPSKTFTKRYINKIANIVPFAEALEDKEPIIKVLREGYLLKLRQEYSARLSAITNYDQGAILKAIREYEGEYNEKKKAEYRDFLLQLCGFAGLDGKRLLRLWNKTQAISHITLRHNRESLSHASVLIWAEEFGIPRERMLDEMAKHYRTFANNTLVELKAALQVGNHPDLEVLRKTQGFSPALRMRIMKTVMEFNAEEREKAARAQALKEKKEARIRALEEQLQLEAFAEPECPAMVETAHNEEYEI